MSIERNNTEDEEIPNPSKSGERTRKPRGSNQSRREILKPTACKRKAIPNLVHKMKCQIHMV
jgi:hypothetical protein